MNKIEKQIREQLEALNNGPLGPGKTYKLTDKRLQWFDRNSQFQKERHENRTEAEKQHYKKIAIESKGYKVEIIDNKGKSHHFDSVSMASDFFGWPGLKSYCSNIFPADGSWFAVKKGEFKGIHCRRLIEGKQRPAVPKFIKQKKGFWVQVKPPNKPWQTFPSTTEASKVLNWGAIGTDTKKYFPEDGSEYTQMYQKFKGYKTRRHTKNS